MTLETFLFLSAITIFLLTFLVLKRRTRPKIRFLASFTAALFVSAVIVFLSFLGSSGYRFVLGVITLVSLVLIVVTECFLKILILLEKKIENNQKYKDEDQQLKTAAFYRSFEEVKNLEAVLNDSSITEQFWLELMSYRYKGMFKRDKSQAIIGNSDISGANLNVSNGIRNTPGNPGFDAPRCCVFGASGVFAYEVPDSKTPTAWLQSLLNQNEYIYKVENHGVGGATIQDCFRRIKLIDLKHGDVVVFVFGGNDVGVNTAKKIIGKGKLGYVPYWGVTLKLAKRHSAIAEMMFIKTTEIMYTDIESNPEVLRDVGKTFIDLSDHLKNLGISSLFFLQPNLYTKSFHNKYEQSLLTRYPKHWGNTVLAGYNTLRTKFENNPQVTFATHIFDQELVSPYLDWGHVNSTGNKIIAQHIYASLVERQLIQKNN